MPTFLLLQLAVLAVVAVVVELQGKKKVETT
jgi:hypothetical protein